MTDTPRHNQKQIEYFSNRPLPRMTAAPGSPSPYVSRQVEAVIAAGGLRSGDRIIDVGCGPGKYTVALSAAGLDVEGLDLTPRLIGELQGSAPHLSAHVGDLMDPPDHLRGQFDGVTGFFVLHHIIDPAAAFAGTAALLRPGGRAVFCEPNPLFAGYYAQIFLTPGMTWAGDRGITRMRPRRLRDHAAEAGFASFDFHRFGALPPALANRPGFARAERAMEAVPGWSWGRAFQIFTLEGRR